MDLCDSRADHRGCDILVGDAGITRDLVHRDIEEAFSTKVTKLGLVQDAWALVLLNTSSIIKGGESYENFFDHTRHLHRNDIRSGHMVADMDPICDW